jgi:hypothetical protein
MLTFWEDVVVPMLESTLDGLNRWLVPLYGDIALSLKADKDTLSALEPRRQIKYDRADKLTFLTVNEKRDMAGYDELADGDGGDVVLVNALSVPLDLMLQTFTSIKRPSQPKRASRLPKSRPSLTTQRERPDE